MSKAPAKVYKDKDADTKALKGKTLAVLGFGSQGHAHAMNLKDSGHNVIIGLYKGSKSWEAAKKKGFKVYETGEAVNKADVVLVALPDMKQATVFERDIEPNLFQGHTLLFLHGLTIHSGLIDPPAGVNIALVAPKGPGHVVRSQFVEGKGVPALIAIHQDADRQAKKIALAWAAGIGATRAGVIQTTFKEETETDLFGEQAVLCGGASALVQAGFETLVEAGYQPEMAYFECLHELKLIVDLMVESGISGMRFSISETAKYGDITRGPRVITAKTKAEMVKILKEIQSGKFTKEWVAEYDSGLKNYKKLLATGEKHLVEKTGQRLRALMPWVQKKNIKGTQADYTQESGKPAKPAAAPAAAKAVKVEKPAAVVAKPAAKTDAKPAAKADSKPAAKTDVKSAAAPAKTTPAPAAKTTPKTVSKPDAKSTAKLAKAVPVSDAKPDAKVDAKPAGKKEGK